jgi:hypothetical protein
MVNILASKQIHAFKLRVMRILSVDLHTPTREMKSCFSKRLRRYYKHTKNDDKIVLLFMYRPPVDIVAIAISRV